MISISFASVLFWWYLISAICGVGLFIYTLLEGPVENGPGTYFVSTLICVGLLIGVMTYL
jgi:hypothetical protein